MIPVYLQRGALHSALGANLSDAASNLLADLRPPAWVFLAGVKVPLSSSDLRRAAGRA